MEFSFDGLIDALTRSLETIFPWITKEEINRGVSYVVLLVAITLVVRFVFIPILKGLWNAFLFFRRASPNEETKIQLRTQKMFVSYIARDIERIDNDENWASEKFAELEAQVETEGRERTIHWLPYLLRSTVRKETSLLNALNRSSEQFILVVGDPGAGKSIALRKLAKTLADKAAKSRRLDCLIPIYVNLKELKRSEDEQIDRALIQRFVTDSVTRINNRNITNFWETHFEPGMNTGKWIFLFDSFDEIPEILSSTEESTTIIQSYSMAIREFALIMSQCRVILASRIFRGPRAIMAPRFRVLDLSAVRRRELISKYGLQPQERRMLLAGIDAAAPDIQDLSKNPLFLGLLCEYVQIHQKVPQTSYDTLSTFIENRFNQDESRILQRYGVSISEMRSLAQAIAFCMSTVTELGLSGSSDNIIQSLTKNGYAFQPKYKEILDALVFAKLARYETASKATDTSVNFTFAHRRFQEYFATAEFRRNPHRVGYKQLLTDARWREAAVVLCQTQGIEQLEPFYEAVQEVLVNCVNQLSSPLVSLQEWQLAIATSTRGALFENLFNAKKRGDQDKNQATFVWPNHSTHILGIIQDAYVGRYNQLPMKVSELIDLILLNAYFQGIRVDQRWAVELCGASNLSVFFIGLGLRSSSWVQDAAYWQSAVLQIMSPEIQAVIENGILRSFILMTKDGRINANSQTILVHLQRLQIPRIIIRYRVFQAVRNIDILLVSATLSALTVDRVKFVLWTLLVLLPSIPFWFLRFRPTENIRLINNFSRIWIATAPAAVLILTVNAAANNFSPLLVLAICYVLVGLRILIHLPEMIPAPPLISYIFYPLLYLYDFITGSGRRRIQRYLLIAQLSFAAFRSVLSFHEKLNVILGFAGGFVVWFVIVGNRELSLIAIVIVIVGGLLLLARMLFSNFLKYLAARSYYRSFWLNKSGHEKITPRDVAEGFINLRQSPQFTIQFIQELRNRPTNVAAAVYNVFEKLMYWIELYPHRQLISSTSIKVGSDSHFNHFNRLIDRILSIAVMSRDKLVLQEEQMMNSLNEITNSWSADLPDSQKAELKTILIALDAAVIDEIGKAIEGYRRLGSELTQSSEKPI